jgi:hypothetical protein
MPGLMGRDEAWGRIRRGPDRWPVNCRASVPGRPIAGSGLAAAHALCRTRAELRLRIILGRCRCYGRSVLAGAAAGVGARHATGRHTASDHSRCAASGWCLVPGVPAHGFRPYRCGRRC